MSRWDVIKENDRPGLHPDVAVLLPTNTHALENVLNVLLYKKISGGRSRAMSLKDLLLVRQVILLLISEEHHAHKHPISSAGLFREGAVCVDVGIEIGVRAADLSRDLYRSEIQTTGLHGLMGVLKRMEPL
jgi:hypothetical protein